MTSEYSVSERKKEEKKRKKRKERERAQIGEMNFVDTQHRRERMTLFTFLD
jgi:CelD/BcsL family acetyltransferase involved in cellulose biosynthesis